MSFRNTPFHAAAAVNRRAFLATTGSLAAAAVWASRTEGAVLRAMSLSDYPFQLGVASGDPSADGFVIWTRLAPKPLEEGGMPHEAVEVAWMVAEDEGMTRPVRQGTIVATPDWAHSVHVEVAGLEPDRWYFYQFKAAGEISPVGRARTFPTADTLAARFRFAFASCQHYEHGLFTAYEHMASEDLDLVAHLGDYIYEYGPDENRIRQHNSAEIESLADYRNRHALYKTDPLLQAAHAMCSWIVTWDDHEFDNNYADATSEQEGIDSEAFLQRRANAYKAYYEHMPLRRAALPQGPMMELYRRVSFGRLAEFFVLDTRQYRTDQPCGDGNKPPCSEALAPEATLLGEAQERWLVDALRGAKCRWNVLAQQVMMARIDRRGGEEVAHSMDQWPGYEANRQRILKTFEQFKVPNPVVITGDIHSNWANNLWVDFDERDARSVATEFVGTSISSGGDGRPSPERLDQTMAENPCLRFHNTQRGYVRCEVTAGAWRTDFRTLEYVTRPGSPIETRASFVVEDGRPELETA